MPSQACPICRPDLWDADLFETPQAQFCPAHSEHSLAYIFSAAQVDLVRDANGVARIVHAEERSFAA